ncbi:MAG: glycosyltransferase family 1 protein [Rhodospirillales bacterium]
MIVNAISAHMGGMVTYTSNVLRHFQHSRVAATICLPTKFSAVPKFPEGSGVVTRGMQATRYGPIRRFLWEQTMWRHIVKTSGADILFSSANYGLLKPPIPQVLLVQGEVSFSPLYQELVTPKFNLRERTLNAMRRRLVLWSARHSDIVIFPSQTSFDSVVRCDPKLAEKSVINYLATDEKALQTKHSRPWRHDGMLRIIYVSVYYPHKDPGTLATATRRLNENGLPSHAWITMEPADFKIWSTGAVELKAVRDEELAGFVSMGRLPHSEVGTSMAGHDVLVSPSLAETFGFPLVEGMAAGIPVVAANTECHREICGDAALYFEPRNPQALCQRLMELDADPGLRSDLCQKGAERVRNLFTWDRHLRALFDCFERLL